MTTRRGVRSGFLLLALTGLLLAAACEGGDGADGGVCDPVCNAGACMTCVNGACQSACTAGQACVNGRCTGAAACTPACDPNQCQVCAANGTCVTSCSPGEECIAGTCLPGDNCDPACDATQCLACTEAGCVSTCGPDEGCERGVCIGPTGHCDGACDAMRCLACNEATDQCESTCTDGQTCQAGTCVPDTACDPGCDPDQCQVCIDGACTSACSGDEVCTAGACRAPGTLSVYDIQDESSPNRPAVDTEVTLSGVIVTAVDWNGTTQGNFWVQELAGGPFSGIRVFNRDAAVDIAEVAVGARVTVTGTYTENYGNSELALLSVTVTGMAATEPQPVVVAAADVASGGALDEEYEGVLVTVEDVTVTNANPDGPDDDFGEMEVTGELRVDDDLYTFDRAAGARYAAITGVMFYAFGERKLLPRAVQDLVAGAVCPGDRDCDTIPDGQDDCPDDPTNACTPPPDGLTVYDLQDETRPDHPADGDIVSVAGVVVTAVDRRTQGTGNFFVQAPTGGPYSGIYVFNAGGDAVDTTALAPGDVVTVTGEYTEYNGLSEIRAATLAVTGQAAVPAPVVVAAAAIATGGADAERYEGVLVRVQNVTVTDLNPDAPQDYGDFEVDGLRVDDDLYEHTPTEGQTFSSLTGLGHYGYGDARLLPRSAEDVVVGD